MNVLVDTSIWSLALRRKRRDLSSIEHGQIAVWRELIYNRRAQIVGSVRQELLSGIRDEAQFLRIRSELRAFPDVAVTEDDYEEAARMHNVCRQQGIAGSATDLLLCAVAARRGWQIFTTDRDFDRYQRVLGINLLQLLRGDG
jgi:predicted nucleic acid-binding protein